MKVLHTADWHIGQLFHEYDRTREHALFLDWLLDTLVAQQVDVLLVSGDIFDHANPSAASVKMFYAFLNQAVKNSPALQIVVTAGNHDSAARLEAPKPLLESSSIHIVGAVEKNETGEIRFDKLLVPLMGKSGEVEVHCLAVPFLRLGDYPVVADCENPYTEGVAALYSGAFEFARNASASISIIAMGHLHVQSAEITDLDNTERLIMGGVESVSHDAFHADIAYVALGHIHKAQRIGGKEHVRYPGSPLPLSFSEINYRHQVVTFELENGAVSTITPVEVPEFVALLRVPRMPAPLEEVLEEIGSLPEADGDKELWPFLELRVLLTAPEPGMRHQLGKALEGKRARLARIDVSYPAKKREGNAAADQAKLKELRPTDVFATVYESKYGNAVPEELVKLFNEVSQLASQQENE
ncbi:MAG: exonuclease SbcCD subunit D C-terminal domain-containing protein [Bacteroidota bacterium]